MVCWIASFPRSGNTLLRQVLKSCYDIQSYSAYNDRSDIATVPEVSNTVGHLTYDGDWDEFYNFASSRKVDYYIKTHDYPRDGAKAIYVVRHPYHAARSYMEYLNRIAGKQVDLIDSICGTNSPFPTWGAHLNSWNPLGRKDTLLIKYEDLVLNSNAQISRIGHFLGITQLRAWESPLDALHEMMPEFFSKGEPSCLNAAPELCRLVRFLYGDWMDRLGYEDLVETSAVTAWSGLLESVAKRHHDEIHKLHLEINRRVENALACRRWAESAEEKFQKQRDLATSYLELLGQRNDA